MQQFCCSLIVCLLSLVHLPAQAEWLRESQDKMGTRVTITLWHEDEKQGAELVRQGMAEFDRIEQAMSTYIDDTELSEVNRHAAERPVAVSADLFGLLQTALKLSRLTDGGFDITYDSVGYLYDYRESQRPDDQAIATGLAAVNYRLVVLDPANSTVRFKQPGVRVNLGGIAKGHSVEQVISLLRNAGVQYASATAGGDTRILGDRRGVPWVIGIRHPDRDDEVVTRLPVIDEAVSTSGDYERFFIEDGERYHHILNPASGKPTKGVRSVTILGPDGTLTDGLSTSVFVLGVEQGLDLIAGMPGYEAVIIGADGRMFYSDGLLAQ